MAKIKINVTQVMNFAGQGSTAQNSVSSVGRDIGSIRNRIDSRILNRNSINSRLINVRNEVNDIHSDIVAICVAISTGAMNYNQTENSIVKNINKIKAGNHPIAFGAGSINELLFRDIDDYKRVDEKMFVGMKSHMVKNKKIDNIKDIDKKISVDVKPDVEIDKEQEEIEWILEFLGIEYSDRGKSIFGETELTEFLAKYTVGNAQHYFGSKEYKIEDSLKSSIPLFGDTLKEFEDKLKDKGINKDLKELKEYYDEDGNEIVAKDAPKFYDREMTIAEIKTEASASATFYKGDFDWGDWGEAGITVGQAEAHSEFSAGFYVLDADGDKKFSPGVKAELGTSVTAFEAEWKNQWLGDEMLGLNTEVKAVAGKASAVANTTIQLFGDNGDLDVQFAASASAEAIAGEIEGSLGVNVLGGEVDVKGGLNFGVGAHADLGYRDGVFKVDLGASLGVGFSVDVEVDVGGLSLIHI